MHAALIPLHRDELHGALEHGTYIDDLEPRLAPPREVEELNTAV